MRRVLRAWAGNAATFATQLARLDPSWGGETFELAGGHVVLCGPGMYVNRAIAVGLDHPLSGAEFDLLEARCSAVGVPAAIEITSASHPGLIDRLTERGYVAGDETFTLRYTLDPDVDDVDPLDDRIIIRPAHGALLPAWQAASALGWGHTNLDARRASDAFAAVAAVVDRAGLVLATDTTDGRPLGCASLTVNGGVATLGGMSTVPDERGRGVQSTMIRYRLGAAARLGCDLATTSTEPDSASYRNLVRHGFEPWFTVNTMTLPPASRHR